MSTDPGLLINASLRGNNKQSMVIAQEVVVRAGSREVTHEP
jgi:hypothetical protein